MRENTADRRRAADVVAFLEGPRRDPCVEMLPRQTLVRDGVVLNSCARRSSDRAFSGSGTLERQKARLSEGARLLERQK